MKPHATSGPSRSPFPSGSGEAGQETLFTIPEKPLKKELLPKDRDTTQEGKNSSPESPLEIRRSILWGTVLESSPLTGNPLGLVPEKEITRVMVRVDKSEAVKGYPNFLQDKETEEIILYSETRQPFFLPAQKIRALVEYQGDKYKRFFWIKQVEPIKPSVDEALITGTGPGMGRDDLSPHSNISRRRANRQKTVVSSGNRCRSSGESTSKESWGVMITWTG